MYEDGVEVVNTPAKVQPIGKIVEEKAASKIICCSKGSLSELKD